MKRLLAFLFLLVPVICFAQGEGTPVRSVSGNGPPGGGVAHTIGTEYIDTSTTPNGLYTCTSLNIATGPTPPAGTITCNWTATGSLIGTNVPISCASSMTFTPANTFLTDFFFNLNCNVSSSTAGVPNAIGSEMTISFTNISPGFSFVWPVNFLGTPSAPPVGGTISATFQYCGTITVGNCTANSWQNTDQGPVLGVIPPSPKNIIDITAPPYNVVFDAKWDLNATFSTSTTNCNGNTVVAGHCLTIGGSASAGAPTFSCGGSFPCSVGGDVGKTVFGYTVCPNTGEQCTTTALARTTITQIFDATHAQSAVAAAASGTGSTMVWGTTGQTTAIQNAFGTLTANPSTAAAIQLPCLTGQQQGGVIWDGAVVIPAHSGNVGVYGCPNGATVLIPTSDMPGGAGSVGTALSDAGTGVGQNNTTQYGTGDVFQNILFWGAGAPINTFGTAAHSIVSIQGPAYLNNFSIEAYLWNVGPSYAMNGINCNACTIVNSTDFAGGNTAQVTNSLVDGGVWGGGNGQQPGLTAISNNGILQAGTTLRGNAYIFPGIGSGTVGLSVPATNTGTVRVDASNVQNISVAGGTLLLVGNGQVNNSQTQSVAPLVVTGGSVDLLDNVWNISNARAWVTCTGGQVRSLGGNTGLAGTGGFTITPPCVFVADGHSVKAVCTGTVTASTTVALISSGTSLTGTGLTTACTGTTLDKGIPAQGVRTLQNLTCTSSATTVAVVCTVMTSHNGGAFASSLITCTMTAATSCTDGVHILTLADGDYVTIQATGGAAETGANIKAIVEWE